MLDAADELAEIRASELVRAGSRQVFDLVYWLEWAASAYMSGRSAICAGDMLVERLQDEGQRGYRCFAIPLGTRASPHAAWYFAVNRLSELGLGAAPHRARFGQLLTWTVLTILSPLVVGAAIVRYGGSRPRRLREVPAVPPPAVIVALHGEDSSRVRHLRSALVQYRKTLRRRTTPVILLGRPRASLARTKRALDPHGQLGEFSCLRPLSFAAWLRALPEAFRTLARGYRAIWRSSIRLPARDLAAIAYRCVQGCVHASWWDMSRFRGGTVLFGHTGTADTSLLEQQIQQSGGLTAHLAHGTNLGAPFAGLSDVLVCTSRHDVALARSFPGYGEAIALDRNKPDLVPGGDPRWVLLTSYTHPMNEAYAAFGAQPDMTVVAMVLTAAQRLGQIPADIVWRPHPMLEKCTPRHVRELLDCVEAAGFSRWPEAAPLGDLEQYRRIITTPSTMLTETLCMGKLPVLAVAAPLQADLVYADHTLVAYDGFELGDALAAQDDPARAEALFDFAWDHIRPSRPLDLDALVDTLERFRS